MSEVAKITLALEAAQTFGRTAGQLMVETNLTRCQVYTTLVELRHAKVVNVVEPGVKTLTFCLSRFGGTWIEPRTATRGKASGPAADFRIVATLGGKRKSLTLEEARELYVYAIDIVHQLRPLFGKGTR